MSLRYALAFVWKTLRARPTRSTLLVSSVAIGMFAIVMLLSLVKAFEHIIDATLGLDASPSIMVVDEAYAPPDGALPPQGSPDDQPVLALDGFQTPLNDADAVALSNLQGVRIVPRYERYTLLAAAGDSPDIATTVQGVWVEHFMPAELQSGIVGGRWLTQEEVIVGAPVTVLDLDLAWRLFPSGNALGQTVTVENQDLTVVGLYRARREALPANGLPLHVPITTVRERIYPGGGDRLTHIAIMADAALTSLDEGTLNAVRNRLLNIRGLRPLEPAPFTVRMGDGRQPENAGEIEVVSGAPFGGIVLVSLVVSCLGVMSSMITSVDARRREIGLLRTIGATGGDIMRLFLIESVGVCVSGAVVGLLASVLLLRICAALVGQAGLAGLAAFVVPDLAAMIGGFVFCLVAEWLRAWLRHTERAG